MEELWDRLESIVMELYREDTHPEEKEFLLQRASYIISELANQYKVITSI
jgi:hypothetical protein